MWVASPIPLHSTTKWSTIHYTTEGSADQNMKLVLKLKRSRQKPMRSVFLETGTGTASIIRSVWNFVIQQCLNREVTIFSHVKNQLMECGDATLRRSTVSQSEMRLTTQSNTKRNSMIACSGKLLD